MAGAGEAAKGMSREDSERLVAHMLQTGILNIDFGFTAYATTAYLKCSPRAAQAMTGVRRQLLVCALMLLAPRQSLWKRIWEVLLFVSCWQGLQLLNDL